jgi:hypothetical protein
MYDEWEQTPLDDGQEADKADFDHETIMTPRDTEEPLTETAAPEPVASEAPPSPEPALKVEEGGDGTVVSAEPAEPSETEGHSKSEETEIDAPEILLPDVQGSVLEREAAPESSTSSPSADFESKTDTATTTTSSSVPTEQVNIASPSDSTPSGTKSEAERPTDEL